jgi:hypothetical protein
MPVPIIDRQRGLSRIGEIRTGGEKPERGAGKKLDAFRLTSQHKDIIEKAAGLYGGQPQPWQSPSGEAWQLYTTASSLPVMVIVGYSLKQTYELREGQSCVRRCDGIHEDYSDGPCICNAEGVDKCDVITRLMVVLPETGTSLGWQLRTQGENAARELAGAIMIAEQMAGGRAFVPATLRLTQRRNVLNGQTVRYVVPVLDFDILSQPPLVLGSNAEIGPPPGHTPVAQLPSPGGVTVAQGLEIAEQDDRARSGRKAPIPAADDDIPFGDAPVPVEAEPAEVVAVTETTDPKATDAQKKKLNVLVGKLRPDHITTEQLYAALARSRNIGADDMAVVLEGRDGDGELHWGPLRDSLSKAEATDLIERLGRLEQNVKAAA